MRSSGNGHPLPPPPPYAQDDWEGSFDLFVRTPEFRLDRSKLGPPINEGSAAALGKWLESLHFLLKVSRLTPPKLHLQSKDE